MTAFTAALLALAGGIGLGWSLRALYEAHKREKAAREVIARARRKHYGLDQ